ncbi:MAG TPA: coenzyme F420-0:L-glutamate ligase [Solirubrobacterales bacterium]|nr:coenzyme F420-0:L-glutamate ligase [Solirubrobacterales bacterium]
MSESLEILPVQGLPEVREGDAVGRLIAAALDDHGDRLGDGDVVCISQKAVSKAEGRVRRLAEVEPGPEAHELAEELGKDPRLVELILRESARLVRAERGVLITETRQGWVCANAGIDSSNVPGEGAVTLLPVDADASARRLRSELAEATGARAAVVISDSFGRPWRLGQTEVAIGCAGLAPVDDWRGRVDSTGRELSATAIAVADELAAAADLVRDKASGVPAVLIRGAGRHVLEDDGPGASVLRRAAGDDLFR